MTEAEWMSCTDPALMLEFLCARQSPEAQALRLRCCRRVSPLLTGKQSEAAIEVAERRAEVAERYAVGTELDEELARAQASLEVVAPRGQPYPNAPAYYAVWQHAPDAAAAAAEATTEAIQHAGGDAMAEQTSQVATLRDIFGNPHRPVSLDPARRTSYRPGACQAAYEERPCPRATSTRPASPSWPTPSKTPAAPTPPCSATCAGRGRTSAAVGHST